MEYANSSHPYPVELGRQAPTRVTAGVHTGWRRCSRHPQNPFAMQGQARTLQVRTKQVRLSQHRCPEEKRPLMHRNRE
jgi:hypothetical protein